MSEFDSLYVKVDAGYAASERERLSNSNRDRERRIGWGGRKFSLPLKDRLLMFFVYYRLYVTFAVAGFLFNIDQSNIFRDIRYIEPLVRQCVPIPEKIHNLTRRLRTVEEVAQYFPDFKAFIDATEQEIPRPGNKRKRKSHYSGKKKRHTVKTQLAVNSKGLIVHRTNHARGRRHDYDVYKQRHPDLPEQVESDFDLGYQGVKKDFPNLKSAIPFKREKGQKELPPDQKQFNKALAEDQSGSRAHDKQGKEVQHLRTGIQEQTEALRFDDRHRLWIGQLQDHGEEGTHALAGRCETKNTCSAEIIPYYAKRLVSVAHSILQYSTHPSNLYS